jgi:hypothetical protein
MHKECSGSFALAVAYAEEVDVLVPINDKDVGRHENEGIWRSLPDCVVGTYVYACIVYGGEAGVCVLSGGRGREFGMYNLAYTALTGDGGQGNLPRRCSVLCNTTM